MTRIRNDETRYDKHNPPQSIEDAEDALEELAITVGEVDMQLKYANPQTFATIEEFRSWHRSATGAISWAMLEISFLKKWVSAEQQRQSDTECRAKAQELWERIQTETDRAMSEGRLPHYSRAHPPEDIAAAYDRDVFLNETQARFNVLTTDLKTLSAAYTLPSQQKRLSGIRTLLNTTRDVIEFESRVVTAYLEKQRQKDRRQIELLSQAFTRAIVGGLVLNPDEHAALDSLRAALDKP